MYIYIYIYTHTHTHTPLKFNANEKYEDIEALGLTVVQIKTQTLP